MNLPLAFAFLFAVGAVAGWVLEFFFRNLISHKGPRGKYFINPGFCHGPWLPIYGIGMSFMFLITLLVTMNLEPEELTVGISIGVIIVIMIVMTLIELIGGLFLLKVMNMRLWDYRKEWGNFMGIICPKFTLIWGAIGAVYFLFIYEISWGLLVWLSNNLAFSFFIGLFAGIFAIDMMGAANEASIIKRYGDDHDIVVKYEELKALIQKHELDENNRQRFFVQTRAENLKLTDAISSLEGAIENKKDALKSKRKK